MFYCKSIHKVFSFWLCGVNSAARRYQMLNLILFSPVKLERNTLIENDLWADVFDGDIFPDGAVRAQNCDLYVALW